ncbi:hypothetical protein BJY04DRAFT_25502 [Aspergillus karnatakaensis]|uniref:copper acquisition factor BIM1-like domain-containing protein n=1 Tax=Aspergillus karnatakaensis TaxID=1810916 RepID=UPI003CCCE801
MKSSLALLVALSTAINAQAHGEEASQEMGPVAFMWPPDRTWGAAYDNIAPCGSNAGVSNRTEFPMVNGQLALVTQDESWNVQISISHRNNPTNNADFETIVSERRISEIDPGHMCYGVPNPGVDTEAGMNATFQIRYTADFETDKNETYYACADVTYVPASQFTFQVPCFNATTEEFDLGDDDDDEDSSSNSGSGSSSNNNNNAGSSGSNSNSNSEETSSGGGGGGLSGGAIAGIVVGAVAALAIALVLLFGYRRLLQKYRTMRQNTSPRNVDWAAQDDAAKPTADNSSGSSYGLRKIR